MRTVRWTLALVGALALTAAACSNGGSSAGSGGGLYGGGSPSAAPTTSAPASMTGGSTTTGGGGGYGYGHGGGGNGGNGGGANKQGGASAMTVTQSDFRFTPSTPSVKSGATITVDNSTDSTPHTFTVTGQSIDVTVEPGTSTQVKVDLPPGTYPFVCRFHEAEGMTGTLTVT